MRLVHQVSTSIDQRTNSLTCPDGEREYDRDLMFNVSLEYAETSRKAHHFPTQ